MWKWRGPRLRLRVDNRSNPKEFFMRSMLSLLSVLLVLTLLNACAPTNVKGPTVFYPALPQQPRLQFLTSITSEEDLGKKTSALGSFIGKEQQSKRIARGHDIGSVKGKWYVSDRTFKTLMIVDLEKQEIDFLKDQREGALKEPFGMHITASGEKYVTDGERKQVVRYDAADKFVRAYGEPGQFERPLDVAVFKERLYVVDFPRHLVAVLDKNSGKLIKNIGKRGTGPGEFDRPTHIRIDKQGNLYVNDSFNFRIQKLTSEGEYVKEYGYPGATLGGFGRPKGLDLSPSGDLLYVVDASFENVQIFSEESTDLLLFFGTYSNAPGSLYLPSALYIDNQNMEYFQRYVDKDFKIQYLVIAASHLGDHKLNVYGFGEWIGEKLPEMEARQPGKADATN